MREVDSPEESTAQGFLDLPAPCSGGVIPPLVLDLFAGMGGLSEGFRSEGFRVIGADLEPLSARVFRHNGIGEHITADLRRESISIKAPVLIGGPPCRPWSVMNVKRRKSRHEQYGLLERFFDHVEGLRPVLFLMENVPNIANDGFYRRLLSRLEVDYSVEGRTLTYSDFGAATKRRRRITVGVRKGMVRAQDFFEALDGERADPTTVEEAIRWLREIPRGGFPDHEWSELKTLDRYVERYDTGKFGWRRLAYGDPAPSFGSVAKTYILHPEAGSGGFESRVVSVREVLSIMGFRKGFEFPGGSSRVARYQMVADAVSPVFSAACARVTRRVLLWSEGSPESL